jgi:glycosyltransferase involved in cell wall biosynthesis
MGTKGKHEGRDTKRLLLLAPFPPSSAGRHGGSRVIAQFIVEMSKRMRIAVLCLHHPSEQNPDESVLEHVDLFEEVPRIDPGPRIAGWLRALRWRLALLRGRPFWASQLRVPAYARRVEDVASTFRPDVVQIEYSVMSQYLDSLAGVDAPTVLVDFDPGLEPEEDLSLPLLDRLGASAWRRFERRGLRKVDAAVVFTDRDAIKLASVAGDTPIRRIPIGTELPDFAENRATTESSILFVGNFVHPPNLKAARRLVTSIFPRVRELRPGCKLYVVGESPPGDLKRNACGGVVVTGAVPDVLPFLKKSAVVVAPVDDGGGMRVKVLEALAAGKALVASSLAVEGLDVSDGEELRIAEDDPQFVARIVELLDDDEERHLLGQRARAWAVKHLQWGPLVTEYERLYQELIDARHASQADHVAPRPRSRNHTSDIHSP